LLPQDPSRFPRRWEMNQKSQGTSGKNRIKPELFLTIPIPLPPLSEQRRIVARIEELAAKIEEAKGLRERIFQQLDNLCRSFLFGSEIGKAVSVPMSQLVTWKKPEIKVSPLEDYRFAGVFCFGRGVFSGSAKKGSEFSYKELTQIETGDFIYPKLMAWEGAFGIVPSNCDGLYVSPEFPVFSLNKDVLLPDTLDIYFKTPSVWPLIARTSKGTNVRRRRLNPSSFLEFQFPLPPMETQLVAREIQRRTSQIGALQTQAELDALLPSILDRAFKGEL
ncbi:MAG: restriction endonuclease subunit S, partial [Deltaproteobacteria bacterium]|nr:restriction endonuclease subunit S [Deltaproteobacteria bacterium]